jgi:hypothetical protein
MGLCNWNCFCHYHLRCYIWRSFQPSHHALFCYLARFSVEEGPILHLRPDLWSICKYLSKLVMLERETLRLRCSQIAALFLVGQYHPQLMELAEATRATGASANSLGGPGSILCSFPAPTQTNYGYLFFIEFFVDSFIGIVIWSVLDPGKSVLTTQA